MVERSDVRRWFFIDQTLRQLFDYYGIHASIGQRIAGDALVRERDGYASAEGVVTHSAWAARSVIDAYGIDPARVSVVAPGASIDAGSYAHWERRRKAPDAPGEPRPLRLVFIGKYWKRKGLDRLLGALAHCRRIGSAMTLRVIGCSSSSLPPHLRNVEGVEWLGFIDKATEADRFLALVGSSDIGCLLSRAEAGGIALREYHALGLVTLACDTGGVGDHVIAGASIVVDPGASPARIGEELLALESEPERLSELRRTAWRSRHEALWEASVARLEGLIVRG